MTSERVSSSVHVLNETMQAGKRPVLENLPTRQRLTGEQAYARSRLVRRLRLILPGIGLILIAAFFLNTNSDTNDARLEDIALADVTAEEAMMINPKFAGLDGDGQPFEITADTAIQDPNTDSIVNLNMPRAIIQDGTAKTLAIAQKGSFQSETNMLELSEEVRLEREINGQVFVLRSPAATVSIEDETVVSTSGVLGEAENGKLRADGMEVFNGERRVVFTGNVRMKFESAAVQELTKTLRDGRTVIPDPSIKRTDDQDN